MRFNPSELILMMNLVEEKIEKLEKQLNLEKDIEMFGLYHHKIEEYREILYRMTKKVETNY